MSPKRTKSAPTVPTPPSDACSAGRITLMLHRSSSAIAIGRLPSALYRPIAMAPLPGEHVVIRSQHPGAESYRTLTRWTPAIVLKPQQSDRSAMIAADSEVPRDLTWIDREALDDATVFRSTDPASSPTPVQ